MNIEEIREILFELITVLAGALCMELQMQIVSDFFVARNPFYNWQVRIAKITGFNCYDFQKRTEYFSIIEYQDNGKKVESVVQRDLRDHVGENIAISVAKENFTVRNKWYLPYKSSTKIFNGILGNGLLLSALGGFWILGVSASKLIVATIMGLVVGFLFHAKLTFNSFYSSKCIGRRFLDGNLNGIYKDAIPIQPMGNGIIEDRDFNKLPLTMKAFKITIWCLIVLEIISVMIKFLDLFHR